MAINIFRNIAVDVTTNLEAVYTTPVGYSAIVLMAQVSNISPSAALISAYVDRESALTSLVTQFEIPSGDAAGILTGKLVLETGQRIAVSASTNSALQLVLSVLESQN
jgi:hypothetical protein